jgi:hypothetical protein
MQISDLGPKYNSGGHSSHHPSLLIGNGEGGGEENKGHGVASAFDADK